MQLFNDRIVDLLSAFRNVNFILSIDGTNETYEYIRYPGKWARVVENCARLVQERKGRLKHSEVNINATMSIPGAMRITDVFDFGKERGFGVNLSNAVDPAHVSTRYLPWASKERLERMLRAYAVAHAPSFPHLPSQIDQWMEDMYSVRTTDPEHISAFHDAMRFLNDMDVTRGLDFKALQPDLAAEFAAEAGGWNSGQRYAGAGDTGSLDESNLTIGSRAYQLASYTGGSIEHVEETHRSYLVSGWAADLIGRRSVAAIAVAIGNDVQFTGRTALSRSDIMGGFGERIDPAGFTIEIMKRGNRPTEGEPVRLYALTVDGFAAPLSYAFDPSMPFAAVEFLLPSAFSAHPVPVSSGELPL
jgi:hypothetical protein